MIHHRILEETLKRGLPEVQVEGTSNLETIPTGTPCIIIYSHKHHTNTGAGNETRQITKILSNLDHRRRSLHIVRPSESKGGRIKQTLSGIHVVIATVESTPDREERKRANSVVLRSIAEQAVKAGNVAITIAPDAGRTCENHPQLVDSSHVSAGGVAILEKDFKALLGRPIPIIPIAIDHASNRITIGSDISEQFFLTSRDLQPSVLALNINLLQKGT